MNDFNVLYDYENSIVRIDNKSYYLTKGKDARKKLLCLICEDFPNLPVAIFDSLYEFFKNCERNQDFV